MGRIILVLFWLMLSPALAHSDTHTAASCSDTDVQSAITNTVASGDTLIIPDGNCTWTVDVVIPTNKTLTVTGTGILATVISGGKYLGTSQSGSRITNIKFHHGYIQTDGDGWRVDHCYFWSDSVMAVGVNTFGLRETLHPTGLVDNNFFHNCRVVTTGWGNLDAHGLWSLPPNLGSLNNVVTIENNYFEATVNCNAADGNYGGAYIFRYNTLKDIYIEAHSMQAGCHRAMKTWQIYNNDISQSGMGMFSPFRLRGGTGVIFNNVINGTWTNHDILMDIVRACSSISPCGKCDGTSAWDGNATDLKGWPCRDEIGMGQDSSLWTAENLYPAQTVVAAHEWNNLHNGVAVQFAPFDAIPPCTAGDNTKYLLSGTNYINDSSAIAASYTPSQCPHPLTGLTGTCDGAIAGTSGYNILNYTLTGTMTGSMQ